jgi:hypothetical protein
MQGRGEARRRGGRYVKEGEEEETVARGREGEFRWEGKEGTVVVSDPENIIF